MKLQLYIVSSMLVMLVNGVALPKTTLEGPNGIVTEDDGSQTIGGTSQGITKSSTGQVTNVGGEGGITISNSSAPVTPASALAGAAAAVANAAAIKAGTGTTAGTTNAASKASTSKNSTASGSGIKLGGSNSSAAAAAALASIFGTGSTNAATATGGGGLGILSSIFGRELEQVKELAKRGDLDGTVERIKAANGYRRETEFLSKPREMKSASIETIRSVAAQGNLARTVEVIQSFHRRSTDTSSAPTVKFSSRPLEDYGTETESVGKRAVRSAAAGGNLARTVEAIYSIHKRTPTTQSPSLEPRDKIEALRDVAKRGDLDQTVARIHQLQSGYAIPGTMKTKRELGTELANGGTGPEGIEKRYETPEARSLHEAARRGDLAKVTEMIRALQGGDGLARKRTEGRWRA